jgi:hypothetical protein
VSCERYNRWVAGPVKRDALSAWSKGHWQIARGLRRSTLLT